MPNWLAILLEWSLLVLVVVLAVLMIVVGFIFDRSKKKKRRQKQTCTPLDPSALSATTALKRSVYTTIHQPSNDPKPRRYPP